MLMIRLARLGKKKQPFYRISVAEKKHPPLGKQVDFIGFYNPKTKELKLDKEKAKYWLDKGAQCSRTMAMIFIKEGLLKKENLPVKYFVEMKRKKKKEAGADQSNSPAPAAPAEENKPAEQKPTEDTPAKEEDKPQQEQENKPEPVAAEPATEEKAEPVKEEIKEEAPKE